MAYCKLSRAVVIGQVLIFCFAVADHDVVDDIVAEHVVHSTFHYGPDVEVQRILKTKQICGSSALWEDIMVQPSVQSIQGIPWNDVIQGAHGYTEELDLLQKSLEQEADQLTDAIRSKRVTVPKYLTKDQIKGLIEESVSVIGSFGSLSVAQNTGCGDPFHGLRNENTAALLSRPRNRVRLPFDAPETSVDALRKLSRNLLTGCQQTSVQDFAETCKELFALDTSYCEELCGALSKTAGGISDMNSASNSCPPMHLTAHLKEVLKRLGEVRAANSDCKYITPWIEQLSMEVTELERGMANAFTMVKEADQALFDAIMAIDTIQEQMINQRNEIEAAMELLRKMGEDVSKEELALKDAEEIEAEANSSLKDAFLNMQLAHGELKKAQEASEVIEKVRGLVSMTMLKMALLFKDAVQVPIEGMGVLRDMHVPDHFPNITNIIRLQEADKLMHDLSSFKTFCNGPAKAAFADVKQHVDLSPLCEFGAVDTLHGSLISAVNLRATKLIQEIEFIQSYLDPMKGQQTITPEMIQQAQINGEPQGFRGIAGVFSEANFYGYLKGWKYAKKAKKLGKFLRLINRFHELLTLVEDAHEKASQAWTAAGDRLHETDVFKKKVELRLVAAIEQKGEQLKSAQDLQQTLENLQTSERERKHALTDLENRLRWAQQAYRKARKSLVAHHKNATNYALIETVSLLIPNDMTET